MVGWKWMGVETLGRGCCRAPEDLATIATAQGDPRTLLDLKLRATDKKKSCCSANKSPNSGNVSNVPV